jgi:hypothetical protein
VRAGSRACAAVLALLLFGAAGTDVQAAGSKAKAPDCSALGVDPEASVLQSPATPLASHACHTAMSHGFPLPDARCTPGAGNPTVTLKVLRDSRFRTGCIRDKASSPAQKEKTYGAYDEVKPHPNSGAAQLCELDHLVSLELGGSDAVENIWPQCGPPGVDREHRNFHRKDLVENYLAEQVEKGRIGLVAAQRGIAQDWTQYLDAADRWNATKHPKKRELDH